jgi:hypothetical protein
MPIDFLILSHGTMYLPTRLIFLYASSLDKPYYYGNNCKDKQNVNDASGVKREKPYQPSDNKNDRQDVKYTSHIFCF